MIFPMSDQYAACLQDESRLSGRAESISFPETETEAAEIVKRCVAQNLPITVQGSRTGLCGGAVPWGGHILNLSRLAAPLNIGRAGEDFLLTVEPGLSLAALRAGLRARRFDWARPEEVDREAEKAFKVFPETFWPPDPSELTASIGGVVSTNGRGPGAFKYGSAARHLHSLRIITAEGNMVEAAGGDPLFQAAVGGEGLFGAIVAITLRLAPRAAKEWGICFFFDDEEGAAAFVDRAKSLELPALAALDFMDGACLKLVADFKKTAAKLRPLPDTPQGAGAAIYMEIHAADEAELEAAAGQLMAVAEDCGGDMETSWSLAGDEMEKLRLFRHAVPEAINAALDKLRQSHPALHKTAADFTWPKYTFSQALAAFRRDAPGFPAFIFGHSTDNHLHVNLLPENQQQAAEAPELMTRWLHTSREQGGHLFREHGVGKVKKALYAAVTPPEEIAADLRLKEQWDAHWLWNPGNKFERGQ